MITKREGKRGTTYRVLVFGKINKVTQKRASRSGTVKTYKEAKRLETALRAELENGTVSPSKDTVAGYLANWQTGRAMKVAPKTHHRQGQLIETINRFIGPAKVADLEADDLEAFFSTLLTEGRLDGQGGLAPRTVQHIHRLLHKAFQDGLRKRKLAYNPAALADGPKVEDVPIVLPDDDQTRAALDALRGNRLWPSIYLMLQTGLRRGEVLVLKWSDIDLDAGHLTVQRAISRVKGVTYIKEVKRKASRRRIKLTAGTVDLLRQWQHQQRVEAVKRGYRNPNDWIMTNLSGVVVNPETFTSAIRAMAARVGVEMSPHVMRHLHATEMLRANVHPKIAQTRLGHSRISTTMDIYSHVIDGDDDAAVEAADAAMDRIMNRGV